MNGNIHIYFFPSAQFALEGYISNRSGGILAYFKSMTHRQLSSGNLCRKIKAVPFEINLKKKLKKRKMASYINLLSTFTNSEFFLYNVTMMKDSFACTYDSFLIMANFNMEPSDPFLTSFCDSNSLINLIKDNCMF